MWGRIMKGPGFQAASQEEYEHLKVEMNLFYHDLNLDLQTIRPSSLKKGEVRFVSFYPPTNFYVN